MAQTKPQKLVLSTNSLQSNYQLQLQNEEGKKQSRYVDQKICERSKSDMILKEDADIQINRYPFFPEQENNYEKSKKCCDNDYFPAPTSNNFKKALSIQSLMLQNILKKSTGNHLSVPEFKRKSDTISNSNSFQNIPSSTQLLFNHKKSTNNMANLKRNQLGVLSQEQSQQFYFADDVKKVNEKKSLENFQCQSQESQSNHLFSNSSGKKKVSKNSQSSSFISLLSRIQEGVEQNFISKQAIKTTNTQQTFSKSQNSSPAAVEIVPLKLISRVNNQNQQGSILSEKPKDPSLPSKTDQQIYHTNIKSSQNESDNIQFKDKDIQNFQGVKNDPKENLVNQPYFFQPQKYTFADQLKVSDTFSQQSSSLDKQLKFKQRKSEMIFSSARNHKTKKDGDLTQESKDQTEFYVPKNQFQFHYKDQKQYKIDTGSSGYLSPNQITQVNKHITNITVKTVMIRKRSNGVLILKGDLQDFGKQQQL